MESISENKAIHDGFEGGPDENVICDKEGSVIGMGYHIRRNVDISPDPIVIFVFV